jgi:hypothetical protein
LQAFALRPFVESAHHDLYWLPAVPSFIAYQCYSNPIIMSPSILSRAAAAAVVLASTASAAFSASSGSNVVVYWGQGADQGPLSRACSDPSIDVVNIAFVNGFPNKVGDYPNTNFGIEHASLGP